MRSLLAVLALVAIVLLGFTEVSSIISIPDIKTVTTNANALEEDEAIVSFIHDGDTVSVITSEGKEERVRLLLIDTPESVHLEMPVQKFGPEASDYAKSYLKSGIKITLEVGNPSRDKYDRLLAYIWVDGVNFNQHMIEQGYARVAYVYEPNTKYLDEFMNAQNKAKAEGKNIWSIAGYVKEDGFHMSVVND